MSFSFLLFHFSLYSESVKRILFYVWQLCLRSHAFLFFSFDNFHSWKKSRKKVNRLNNRWWLYLESSAQSDQAQMPKAISIANCTSFYFSMYSIYALGSFSGLSWCFIQAITSFLVHVHFSMWKLPIGKVLLIIGYDL